MEDGLRLLQPAEMNSLPAVRFGAMATAGAGLVSVSLRASASWVSQAESRETYAPQSTPRSLSVLIPEGGDA
jgi:hypothetical protein